MRVGNEIAVGPYMVPRPSDAPDTPQVFVVSDEGIVRDLACCLLEAEGFQVVEPEDDGVDRALVDIGGACGYFDAVLPLDLVLRRCAENALPSGCVPVVANCWPTGPAARAVAVRPPDRLLLDANDVGFHAGAAARIRRPS
jgi:hypothetical protein